MIGATGEDEHLTLESLFVMIGARPRTEWLPHDVQRDKDGFLVTGAESAASELLEARSTAAASRDHRSRRVRDR